MKGFIEFIKSNPLFLIPVTVVLVLIVVLVLLILALSAQVKLEKASKKKNSAGKQNNTEMNENSKETLDDSLDNEPIHTDFNLEPTQPKSELPIMQEEIAPNGTLTDAEDEATALEEETVVEVPLITSEDNQSSNLIKNEVKEEARTDITFSSKESDINNI